MARVALVTGGTRGIGAAIAKQLKDEGHAVVASYAGNDEKANAFRDETGITIKKFNVGDYAACRNAADEIAAEHGAVEILVNNAGITRDAMFHRMTPEQWHEVIDTNLTGVFNMTHVCWPAMREAKWGRVVTISSINGQKGQAGQVNYSAAKAGDIGLTRALAQEGARAGITVNVVAPGYINTDMMATIPEKVMEGIVGAIPAGRLGEPGEIARCVAFLAGEDAGFITGSVLSANGGQFFA